MATLGMEALTTEGYAGKRPAEHFIEGWQTVGLNAPTTEAMCRQTAGCNAGTTGAYGNSRGLRPQGWVKLPRGALGRDALTTEGYSGKRPAEDFKRFRGLKVGKCMCRQLQVATLEQQGLTATGLGGSCREEGAARRPWHGRPNSRGLGRQTAGGAL